MELESSATCDVELERSYLACLIFILVHAPPLILISVPQIDFSKGLIEWVKADGYSLLDANLFPKPATVVSSVSLRYFRYGIHIDIQSIADKVDRGYWARYPYLYLGQLYPVRLSQIILSFRS